MPLSPLPPEGTPLYHHPLPALEEWLRQLGARRQPDHPEVWDLQQPRWSARIELETEELKVSWDQGQPPSVRHFPYGLSRADVEAAILAGP
ncbi:MAG TPA: DUF3143 domain-containing protein [Cyanobium sp.]|nr:DUF3143 domain-containing protein [Cyanobium sp.]